VPDRCPLRSTEPSVYGVLALLLTTLLRRTLTHRGLVLSISTILQTLSAIKEVALLYPGARHKPVITYSRLTKLQQQLVSARHLDRFHAAWGIHDAAVSVTATGAWLDGARYLRKLTLGNTLRELPRLPRGMPSRYFTPSSVLMARSIADASTHVCTVSTVPSWRMRNAQFGHVP
jgi:hypothetical protein